MFIQGKGGKGDTVIYSDDDGNLVIRSGGTRSWRNNNPGNIRPGSFSSGNGSIGSAGGFAVFPTYEAGRQALAVLLRGKTYSGLTLFSAVARYAPHHENNTANYRRLIKKLTGLDLERKIKTLNGSEFERLLDAIETIEGFKEGNEKLIKRTRVIDTEKGKGGSLERFLLDGEGWVGKSDLIQLVRADLVINAVLVRANGSTYVRSKPDQTTANNFSEMADS